MDIVDSRNLGANLPLLLSSLVRNFFVGIYQRIVYGRTCNISCSWMPYHTLLPEESGFDATILAYSIKEIPRIIQSLPDEYRIPFSMCISGFRHSEIAEKLDLPLKTVRTRIAFTKRYLQQVRPVAV